MIVKADVIHIAVIAIVQQIVKIVLDDIQAQSYKKGDRVSISTKAFSPTINPLRSDE